MIQILDGLTHIHVQNIVHRDIKPSNILIKVRNLPFYVGSAWSCAPIEEMEVAITDFGFARQLEDQCQNEMTRIFTPGPVAPEISGNTVTPNVTKTAEMFQIGTVVYRIIKGKLDRKWNDYTGKYPVQNISH